ncbi:MAG: hypothetical protein U0Y68_08400 [Blastocatellia bacterium]
MTEKLISSPATTFQGPTSLLIVDTSRIGSCAVGLGGWQAESKKRVVKKKKKEKIGIAAFFALQIILIPIPNYFLA